MQDDMLGQRVHAVIMDVCAVLYSYGIREISVGSLMRLVGVPENRAQSHDHEIMQITDDIQHHGVLLTPCQVPPDVTLH